MILINTKRKAKNATLLKWRKLAETGWRISDDEFIYWCKKNKAFSKYNFSWAVYSKCGYCEYYENECLKCALKKVMGHICIFHSSIYVKFKKAKTIKTRKKYAAKMVDLIERS
jgi:hypothetical protein